VRIVFQCIDLVFTVKKTDDLCLVECISPYLLDSSSVHSCVLYEYDGNGRMTKMTNPQTRVTEYTYDDAGNRETTKDPRNKITNYTYDEMNRLTQIKDPLNHTTDYAHDYNGNVIQVTDARTYRSYKDYTPQNQLAMTWDDLSTEYNATVYEYDLAGNLTKVTDPTGSETAYTYDGMNRKEAVWRSDVLVEASDYDDNGNLISRTMYPNIYDPQQTTYTHDGLNRMTTETPPIGPNTTYAYNNTGDLITKETGANVITYEHDYLHRMTEKTFGNDTYEYEYNKADLVNVAKGPVMGNTLTDVFSYDELKRVTREQYTVGPIIKTVTYDNFDAAGNLTDMTGPEGQSWHYTYDDANRLTKTEKSSATLVEMDYLDNDITENVRYAGIPNLGMFYTHDAYNRLEEIDFRNTAGTIDQRAHEFTVDRQIEKITEDAGVQDFTYDDLKRLDTASDTRDEASLLYDFGYDDTGGRTSYRVSGKYGTTETIVTGRIQGSTEYEKLFEDDFEDGILGPEWEVLTGTWWEADGSLHGIMIPPGSNPGGIIIRGQSYWHEYALNVDMYWPAVWEPEHPAVGILFNMDDDQNHMKLNFRQDAKEIRLREVIDGTGPNDPMDWVDVSDIPDGDLLNVYIKSIGLDVFVVVTSSVGQYILSGTATTHVDGNIAFRTTETEMEITQARVDALVRTAHDYDAEGSLSTRTATALGGTVDMGSETFTFDAEDRIKHIERIARNGSTRNIYYAYDALGRRFAVDHRCLGT